MNQTQKKLILRALKNGGKACVIQAWGRKPTGGAVRAGSARELKALHDLIDTRAVTYARFPADPNQTHRFTANGYTEHSVEHVYTLTDHGRAIVEYLIKNDLLKI
jgi:hypothetical protein